MGDCIILKSSGAFDDSALTAVPARVRCNKTFMGKGSPETQTGSFKDNVPIKKEMAVNESYSIPAGYHDGTDLFVQDRPVMEGPVVDPGAGGITVEVSGRRLSSDTIIQNVDNLKPENIKNGVVIGEGNGAVTGNFQGFVD